MPRKILDAAEVLGTPWTLKAIARSGAACRFGLCRLCWLAFGGIGGTGGLGWS